MLGSDVQKEDRDMTLNKFKKDVETIVESIKEDSSNLSKLIEVVDASTTLLIPENQPAEK